MVLNLIYHQSNSIQNHPKLSLLNTISEKQKINLILNSKHHKMFKMPKHFFFVFGIIDQMHQIISLLCLFYNMYFIIISKFYRI